MEIVKLIGSDVLPDDQKLTLEIARVIRLGFLQPVSYTHLSAFYERAGMMQNLNGTEGSVSIIGAVSPQGGDFSEPVTQNTKRFVRCFWGLDKSLAYARHFPAIHWLTSYSEYLEDLTPWYREHVSPKFVADRNQMCIRDRP